MKLHAALTSIVLSLLFFSVGCSQKDFTGKAISKYLGGGPEDNFCAVPKSVSSKATQSPFEKNNSKLHLVENNYGAATTSVMAQSVLEAGKELVVVTDEKCVLKERTENNINVVDGLTSGIEISEHGALDEKSHLVKTTELMTLSELSSIAENDPCVKGVGENIEFHLMMTPNDPQFSQQEHLNNIKAPQGWDEFFHATTGITQEVVVAIIDSGVEWTHSDLSGVMWKNTKETPNNNIDDDGNGYVDDIYGYNFASNIANPAPQRWTGQYAGAEKHGTHVAGLASGHSNNSVGTAGVNGLKVKIMALNVFGASPGASTPNIDNAIRYAADMGAHVINMSLGGRNRADSTGSAISYAINKGTAVVVAAGNDNTNIQSVFYTPASFGPQYSGMLTIGAINSNNSAKCSFSNYSTSHVEMAAPGCEDAGGLLATVTNNSYGRLQGTSMASPVAAGATSLAYALVWTRKGSAPTPADIEDIMKAGARVESGLSSYFKDGKTVDLVNLSKEINTRYPAGATPTPTPSPGPTPNPSPCP